MSATLGPDDLEPDEDPIEELALLLPDPDPNFADEVKSRIDHREVGGHLTTLSWLGLAEVAGHLWNQLCSLIGAFAPSHRDEDT